MHYPLRRSSFVLFVLLSAMVGRADDLTTIAGKKYNGKLVAVDREGVTFRSGTIDNRIPGKELLVVDLGNRIVAPAKDAKYHEIELTDGSLIRCGKFSIKGSKFEIELIPGPAAVPSPVFELPLASVFYVCRGADDQKNRDEWKKMLLGRGKRDLYVIRQADGLNFVQGTVIEGSADGSMVAFEKEGGVREDLRLSRATGGLVFNQPPAAQVPPTLCKVVDVLGNSFVAQAVETTGMALRITTVAGVVVSYPSAAAVAKLDFSQGNIAYLSDLQPQVDSPELPPEEVGKNLNLKIPYLADKGPTNEPLKVDGTVYQKGLWIPADTTLTYSLGGDYREVKLVVGIHDNVGDAAASVRVTIDADGRVLFSDTVKRKDKPKGLTLDVKNAKQLRIQVESDSPFFNGSQAVLGIAQLQK